MIREFFAYTGFQGSALLVALAFSTGAVAYNLVNPAQEAYRDNMYRATTYTGKGQFRCQTGC